ncbi:hypothetical protein PENTCL1PPCAC_19449 [Pristionchus entomophagus]|uniref:PI31 proteasome regulator C-terminal domain-containing protein n=1 Tax=Pristionchus entomophagus TaxID=358040 RepID=A0AAV5TS41_9BILA|nr:hypothetical protein PENTCL1PPCAC_19449 [Pristionchus entomophagus]
MLATEFRKLIVDTAEKQLNVEGYELITRSTPLPEAGLDEYKPTTAPAHRCALSVHVWVLSQAPLAATLTITRRLEGGDVEFEPTVSVRPMDAEARVRDAIAVAIAKSGEVSLSRVLSLVPVQSGVLRGLHARDAARLMHANRAVRAALSTKHVDVSYWKAKFNRDFPDETVEDASSPSTYRRLYSCHAMRALEEKRNRKRANRPRMIDSPDLWEEQQVRVSTTPPRPVRPHAPDPDLPQGPLGRDPNVPDFPLPFNPLFPHQPANPLMEPRRGPHGGVPDDRNPFGPFGGGMMPGRPQAPRGLPRQFHNSNDYI